MLDPREGLSSDGVIVTGVGVERIPSAYQRVVREARKVLRELGAGSVYLYGSVATGQARPPSSDVDLIAIDVPEADALPAVAHRLSAASTHVCRAVAIAAAQTSDFEGEGDEIHGNRIFLRHYCVHLDGLDPQAELPLCRGDAGAARAFNGDIARRASQWAAELDDGADPEDLGRRLARKTLFATAGLVSVAGRTWTTDRATAARAWSVAEPNLRGDLDTLLRWVDGDSVPTRAHIDGALTGVVRSIVSSFAATIGLWS